MTRPAPRTPWPPSRTYEERFGKENADYLMETMGEWHTRYERGAFLDTGLEAGADDEAAERARDESERRGWRFERVPTDLDIVRRLLTANGTMTSRSCSPAQHLAMSYDDGVVRAAGMLRRACPAR